MNEPNVANISEVQARRMAQVRLDLHEALGVKWGEDPYSAIRALAEAAKQEVTGAVRFRTAFLKRRKPDTIIEACPEVAPAQGGE